MTAEVKVLDLLFRQTAPEEILDILKRDLRGDPEDFTRLQDQYGKKGAFFDVKNQPLADRSYFLDIAEAALHGCSEDEHILLYEQLGQRRKYWEGKGITEACGFLVPLLDFSRTHLKISGVEPICKAGMALDWRDAYLRLGQDIFVTTYLAWWDHDQKTERARFYWPVILRTENERLYFMLKKGIAENHNHLAGGTQSFQVTWCRMMNYPEKIREELLNFLNSNLFAKLQRGKKRAILDKFDQLELAALIRSILFRCLHKDAFSVQSLTGGTDLAVSGVFDGRAAFAREYLWSFSARNHLEDLVKCLRTNYGIRFHVLGESDYCLDYALEDAGVRSEENFLLRVVLGERSILYKCIRACLDGRFSDFEKELFYLYLVLQCNFRSEMIQNNDQVGFMNFKKYQDRKDDAWDTTPYLGDAVGLALNNRIRQEQIVSLECRVVPKPEPEKNIEKVVRYDLGKRFADCGPGQALDRKNYEFNIELDEKKFRGVPWFYIFHFIKVQDNRVLVRNKFSLPVCRHQDHRDLVKKQARGFVEALRESSYFRSRVRGIDAASDEVFCRPEVFAVAFRYIDDIQLRWNAADDGILPSSPIRISKTYHAGEDFLDLAGGLRAVDEAVRFLHLGPGCRIGHGLALGVDPEIHYRTKHYDIVTTKQERLDDLVWILFRGKQLGVGLCSEMEARLIGEAKQLLQEIYGDTILKKGWDGDLRQYWCSMQLRGDDPSVYGIKGYEPAGMDADEICAYLIDREYPELDHYRRDKQVAGLYYYYQYGVREGLVGEETCICHASPDYIRLMRKLQDAMIREIGSRDLIIETNPSSNVLIGTFKDYSLHPVFRFNNRKLVRECSQKDNWQLNVCVNTDDLGVFDTSLEFEYALLYEALQKQRDKRVCSDEDEKGKIPYSDQDILEYLDDLREMGIQAVFQPNIK